MQMSVCQSVSLSVGWSVCRSVGNHLFLLVGIIIWKDAAASLLAYVGSSQGPILFADMTEASVWRGSLCGGAPCAVVICLCGRAAVLLRLFY